MKGEKVELTNIREYHFDANAPFVTFHADAPGLPPAASFPVADVSRILRADQLGDDA